MERRDAVWLPEGLTHVEVMDPPIRGVSPTCIREVGEGDGPLAGLSYADQHGRSWRRSLSRLRAQGQEAVLRCEEAGLAGATSLRRGVSV